MLSTRLYPPASLYIFLSPRPILKLSHNGRRVLPYLRQVSREFIPISLLHIVPNNSHRVTPKASTAVKYAESRMSSPIQTLSSSFLPPTSIDVSTLGLHKSVQHLAPAITSPLRLLDHTRESLPQPLLLSPPLLMSPLPYAPKSPGSMLLHGVFLRPAKGHGFRRPMVVNGWVMIAVQSCAGRAVSARVKKLVGTPSTSTHTFPHPQSPLPLQTEAHLRSLVSKTKSGPWPCLPAPQPRPLYQYLMTTVHILGPSDPITTALIPPFPVPNHHKTTAAHPWSPLSSLEMTMCTTTTTLTIFGLP